MLKSNYNSTFLHKNTYKSKEDRITLFRLSTWPLSHGHARAENVIIEHSGGLRVPETTGCFGLGSPAHWGIKF